MIILSASFSLPCEVTFGLRLSPLDTQERFPQNSCHHSRKGQEEDATQAKKSTYIAFSFIAGVLPGPLFGELPEFLLASGGQQKGLD
jgi:hypothetical protein